MTDVFPAVVAALLLEPAPSVGDLRVAFRRYLDHSASSRDPAVRAPARVIRHLLFLLDDGPCLYESCQLVVDGRACKALEVHRVADGLDTPHKVFARISANREPPDPHALHEYVDGPSISIHHNPIVVRNEPGHIGLPIPSTMLTKDDVRRIFRRKQQALDCIRATRAAAGANEPAWRSAATERRTLQAIFQKAQARPRPRHDGGLSSRANHPYHGPRLQVLPRLVRPREGLSALRIIANALDQIREMGFSGLMLCPVDKQSVSVYFGETHDGQLIAHANNHGYWCSGEVGIDPALGTEQDYRTLMARAARLNVDVMQDCVLATLGYLPQLGKYALSNPCETMKQCYRFLDGPGLRESGELEGLASAEAYAEALHLLHVGAAFELPRPDLHAPDTYRSVMARPRFLIEAMGAYSFRIDMAKYLEIGLLRQILGDLRATIRMQTQAPNLQHPGSFLLEYWTTDYRDLKIASVGLGPQRPGVYFYDFPLAKALQDIFVRNEGFLDVVHDLLAARDRWGIDIRELIPVFIDHDFLFRPIYNGSPSTSAIVVAGFVLSLMLSANGPCIYSGYGDKAAGAPDLSDFFLLDERHSRRVVDDLLAPDDPLSPTHALADVFKTFHKIGILENWDASPFAIAGDSDKLVVCRSYCDPVTKAHRQVLATFARSGAPERPTEHDCELLFSHDHCPSVAIFITSG